MKKIDSKHAVECFLLKSQNILSDKSFDINKNFYFHRFRTNYSENNRHTNDSTLIELNYGLQDIVNEIKTLTVKNYKETVIDNKIGRYVPFYCFIKNINGKQVYIKFKISEVKQRQIFCISFHFAEIEVKEGELPYNK